MAGIVITRKATAGMAVQRGADPLVEIVAVGLDVDRIECHGSASLGDCDDSGVVECVVATGRVNVSVSEDVLDRIPRADLSHERAGSGV